MIDDLQISDEWKIDLTIKPKFMSYSNEKHMVYSKSDYSIVVIGNHADEIVQELFQIMYAHTWISSV